MSAPVSAPHEASAWMREQLARVEAQVAPELSAAKAAGAGVVMAPLGRSAKPGSFEDRTCDRCRLYVAGGLFCFTVAARLTPPYPSLLVTGGLCDACTEAEGMTPR